MNPTRGLVHALLLPVLALGTAACGYTAGSGLHQKGIRTVFVEVAGNDTFRQRLEVELNDALARELAATSDLLPAGRREADAVLELRLGEASEQTLVYGDRGVQGSLDGPTREGGLVATVHMRLVDRRTGKTVVERRIVDRAEFRSPLGEDLTSANRELARDLARKVALALADGF